MSPRHDLVDHLFLHTAKMVEAEDGLEDLVDAAHGGTLNVRTGLVEAIRRLPRLPRSRVQRPDDTRGRRTARPAQAAPRACRAPPLGPPRARRCGRLQPPSTGGAQ